MKLGYFPGCSLSATAKEFDESLRAVLGELAIEISEIEDWACCGATSAHATNHLLSVALPARTLKLAEEQNHASVLAPCAACYSRLSAARHAIQNQPKLAARVTEVLGGSFENSVNVINVVGLLRDLVPTIKPKVTKPLAGLKVASYYGCLLLRPPEVTKFDDPEAPTSMDDVVRATGATPVRWNMATNCCGGAFSLSRSGSVIRLGRQILEDAASNGAQALVVACPMCQSNLDLRQQAIARESAKPMNLPILYLPQLVGLSLGIPERRLGLERHFVSPAPMVAALSSKALPTPSKEA